MGLLSLVVDRQGKKLASFNGSVVAVPDLFQSNVQTIRVQVVDPTGNLSSPYTVIDLASAGLRVSVGDPATTIGTTGGTPIALQDTFVWNAAGKYFQADLALSVAAVDTFLGVASSKTAILEINTTLAGARETILQATFNLRAVVDELTSTVPTPTDQYLTKAETLAGFVKFINSPGDRIVLKSANGVYGLELGCNDDGTMLANVITL